MHTKKMVPLLLTLGSVMSSLPAFAQVKLSAETNKVFTEVCAACHAQFTDSASIADEAAEIIKRLDPKAPEELQMPPSYAPEQVSDAVKARIIKDLQRLK